VVRIGETVRKPWRVGTPAVVEFMGAVRSAGVDVPEVLGRDDQGRQVLEFVPGTLAMNLDPLSVRDLARVGGIVRAIHDASEGFMPAGSAHWESVIASPGSDLICHGDLTPWNLIIGDRWVFIDWDGSAPSTRLWDLAYAAQACTLNDPNVTPEQAADRLAAFVAGYKADEALRAALPSAMVERVAAMYELLRSSHAAGVQPWATMYRNGHGDHWRTALHYVESHQEFWNRALSTDTPEPIL
jgi:Ser/Thr protein kinase RdoA (MazF antagonist)